MENEKWVAMINIVGTNIISSLGFTTKENFENVKRGISGVRHYDAGMFDLSEAFAASIIDKERLRDEFNSHFKLSSKSPTLTDLEKAAILSVYDANKQSNIDLSSKKTIFIISTTKGNIDLLKNDDFHCGLDQQFPVYLWHSAKLISTFFGNPNTPIVSSNACISGATAQIAAFRELDRGNFDNTVVVGVDFLSKFIISGFQSFKALSPDLCKPFDTDRNGLNLGEATATIIMSNEQTSNENRCHLVSGCIRNDSNHISGPSRTGEGSFRTLNHVLQNIDKRQIAFINAHGTATPYNDAMETVVVERAGLQNVPLNSLKGYFGHTLGAAGVLESVISMKAIENEIVLPILNFNKQNAENQINIPIEIQKTDKPYFIKMLSGFGGVNAALLFKKCSNQHSEIFNKHEISGNTNKHIEIPLPTINNLYIKKYVRLSFDSSDNMTEYYRNLQVNYPKFFKMDNLSKIGLLASEIIFENVENRFKQREDVAIICFNRSSSMEIDMQYQTTIATKENYFPSPSLFVYTLPNIVTGEIAIRNKFYGETSFFICENFDVAQICRIVNNTFCDKATTLAIVAWIESIGNTHEAFMILVDKNDKGDIILKENTLMELYNNKSNKMENLILKLKEEIIEVLNLEDVKPADIDEDAPLFGEGLGLDSIDALELIVLMEKNYGIKLKDPAQGKEIFKSVRVLAKYIAENRTK